MWPIVTDGVAWSDGRSVCWSVTIVSPTKMRCHLGYGLGWAKEIVYWIGSRFPMQRGNFEGGMAARCKL